MEFSRSSSKTISQKEKFIVLQKDLVRKRDKIEIELYDLKKDNTYKTLLSIDDWADYFKQMKEKLTKEIENYEHKIASSTAK